MSPTASAFAQAVQEHGILTAEVAPALVDAADDTDAVTLANRLVKDGYLTAFQARSIYEGRAGSLVLGPYVVLDLLGRGGMGHVYKALHRPMRRIVALKVMASTALPDADAVRRFEREAQAAARLEHPNIVTAYDAGRAGDTLYLAMQYVAGRNLAEIVREYGPQPPGRALDWVLQVARGLAFAHDRGVVHRDIKPGNLLVDDEGTVRILDMGLARLEATEAAREPLTATGQVMGTVDFMAPEQALDLRRADGRADIYALGATLWFVLTGRPLFEADSVVKRVIAHQETPPPSLLETDAGVGRGLDAVFRRMVAKRPDDRFQSMHDLVSALGAVSDCDRAPGPPRRDFRAGTPPPPRQVAGHDPAADPPRGRATREPVVGDAGFNPAATETMSMAAAVATNRTGGQRTTGVSWRMPVFTIGSAAAAVLLGALVMFGEWRPQARPAAAPGRAPRNETRAPPAALSPTPVVSPPLVNAPFGADVARRVQETWARHLGVDVEITNTIGMRLVVIPPGAFRMGEGDAALGVTFTRPILVGRTEVTQGEWQDVMETEPWRGQPFTRAGREMAATFVSWDDAVTFCERLTRREREAGRLDGPQAYRLPTEAEWEYACRAGTDARYSFGDGDDLLDDHGWFGGGVSGTPGRPVPGGNTSAALHAHPVGLKRPNAWGLHDMHGNVWEWCADLSTDAPMADGLGEAAPGHRAQRGGCWLSAPVNCGSASRHANAPEQRMNVLGFRVVLDLAGLPLPVGGPGGADAAVDPATDQ
jgi:formylglycine-generating enzyme required for sulfatase activity